MARVRSTSLQKPLRIVEEAPLAFVRRRAAEPAEGVERRQQGQADAGVRAGLGDARRHLAEIGVGPAVDVVMEIVKLADRGEARFEHLHVGEGGDRLDVVGRKPAEETVHHLAPGPEAVGARTAPFGQRGHAALEGVAMQVRQARNGDAGDVLGAVARGACRHRGYHAVGDGDANVARPARRQQRMVEEQFASQIIVSTGSIFRKSGNRFSVENATTGLRRIATHSYIEESAE